MKAQLRNLGWCVVMAVPMVALAQGKSEEKKAAAQEKKEAAQAGKPEGGKPGEGGKPEGDMAMQMPKPATELEQLKALEGNWNCKGKYHASPMGPEKQNVVSTMKVKRDLDGFFYVIRFEEKGSKEHKTPWKSEEVWGHQGGTFTRSLFDNFGGSGQLTSAGWEGDKMVWTGETMGMGGKMPTRQTFTRKGKELHYLVEFGGQGGSFAPAIEQTCKK